MYVASDRTRAASALYSTVLMLAAAAWQLTSGRCSGDRYVCMRHCGQRCQYQIAHAVCTWQPGHWLAWPAHTSCVHTSCIGVNFSRTPLIRNFKDFLHFISFIWAHIIIYLFIYLFFIIICYYLYIVKLVTKMERLIDEGMPDDQKTEHCRSE